MKITEQKLKKLVELAKASLTDQEIATALGVHVGTVIYWKRKMRDAGYDIPATKGRKSTINLDNIKL